MAALTQKEQLAFHEYSVRYRQALAKQHPFWGKSLNTVQNAVREQYEQEQTAERDPSPSQEPTQDKQPDEPDME